MEIDYVDSNKYFNGTCVKLDITRNIRVDNYFYVRKRNGNSRASYFCDVERLSCRLSQDMIKMTKDFYLSNYRRLKITLELE